MRYNKDRKAAAAIIPLLLVALVWAGCGEDGLTTPNTPVSTADSPPQLLGSSGYLFNSNLVVPASWDVVGVGSAHPKKTVDIVSEKCVLTFGPGSVAKRTEITISMYDPSILDFQFGPSGIVFDAPVFAEVSYAGTNADPDEPHYDGTVPAFFYFNSGSGAWEQIPGAINEVEKTYSAEIQHFSRYALGGIPGDGTADW